jgi:CHAT domain-containing protein
LDRHIRTGRTHFLVGAVVLAIAGVGAYFALNRGRLASSLERDLRIAASDQSMPTGGARLSGLPFAQHPSQSASDDEARREGVARLLAARSSTAATDLNAAAQFALMASEHDVAAALLEKAIALGNRSPVLSANLAAVYLAMAEKDADRRMQFLARALDSAGWATRTDPQHAQAWFNLALAFDAAGLKQSASDAWERAAHVDTNPEWRREAVRRAEVARRAVSSGWPAMRTRLLDSSVTLTPDEARRVANDYPQPLRELLEEELLPAWAEAYLAHKTERATATWTAAATLSAAIADVTKDCLLRDTLAAFDQERGPDRGAVATGLVAYAEGRRAYEENRFEDAGTRFADAARALAPISGWQSPFVGLVHYQSAVVDYQRRQLPRADATLATILAEAARRDFGSLAARAELLRGMVRLQSGDTEGALAHYGVAAERFRGLRESENIANAANSAADTLRLIGQHDIGWAHLGEALQRLPELRSARRRYVMLLNASLYAAEDELPVAALLFQNASISAARERGVANTLAEGFTRRAALYLRTGELPAASDDLQAADTEVAKISSEASQQYQRAWLEVTRGDYLSRVNPRAALPSLEAALTYFEHGEPAEVPRIYLRKSRAQLALGDEGAAERSLQEGIRQFERRWQSLQGTSHRVSYLDDSWDLFDEIVQLYAVRRQQPDLAFRYCESSRARALRGIESGDTAVTPRSLQATLGPNAAVLYFATLKQRLLVWTITASSVHFDAHDLPESRLAARVAAYRHMLEVGRTAAEIRSLATALYDDVVRSAVANVPSDATLIIVPDGVLHALPFATLVDATTGRFLLEQHPLALAPNAKQLLRSSSRLAQLAPQTPSLLAIGNTTASPRLGFPSLPYAAVELREIAGLYPRASLLLDDRATVEAFRHDSPAASVIHFAGHAKANLRFPDRSQLVLAPSRAAPDGVLQAGALENWRLDRTALVVLGACQTATGTVYRGEGLVSLACPFLSAGAPSVLGTLWEVDDRSTRQLLATFHKQYLSTRDPLTSLWRAQLDLLRSRDVNLQQAAAWGAFVLISGLPTSR